ncbi:MAG: ADP-ribosylglycohydrolase family protein [Anaerolineae bacterium]|nr:ADP-ribosylglycohydrolase family protein [Anaerolineae bacterium]
MQIETYVYPHIAGALFGQVLGSAWAMPAFFQPEQTWDKYGGWLETLVEPAPNHPLYSRLKMGQITGDTQQAIALGQMIVVNRGRVTLKRIVKTLIDWYDKLDSHHSAALSQNVQHAFQALKAGDDPHLTGLHTDTKDSAVRVSPIGLIHPGDPEAAVEEAIISCIPTHYSDIAVSGTCAVAAAVAQALTPNTTLEDIADTAIWAANVGLTHGHPWYGPSIGRRIDFAIQLATDTNYSEMERIQNLHDLIGVTLAVGDSVPCAFGILALADGDPVRAAIYASALSGDAAAVGAMACVLAGAWRGIDSIPAEYIDVLRQANPQYDLEEIAEGLYAVAIRNHSATPHVGTRLLDDILDEN